jgi:KaiC/GvpD/RAD55 family RecA-like ATPase
MSDAELLMKKVEGLLPDYMGEISAFIDQLTHKAPEDQWSLEQKREAETMSTKEMFDEAARRLGYKDDADYLRANSPATIEEAIAEAARKRKTRKSIYEYYGCLKGEDIYGDGMEYQRMMRDEWSHRP